MILVDTNVLLDVVTNDPVWAEWSVEQLEAAALRGPLVINDIVYAELSVRMRTGTAPGEVFDELLARREIVIHGLSVPAGRHAGIRTTEARSSGKHRGRETCAGKS